MEINYTTSDFLSTEQPYKQAGAAKSCHGKERSLCKMTGNAGQQLTCWYAIL